MTTDKPAPVTDRRPFSLPAGHWQSLVYPRRIPPLPKPEQRLYQRFFLWLIRRKSGDGDDLNVFLVLARLGRIFPIHAMLVSELLRGEQLGRQDTERVIIRVAWRVGCQYEYAHHTAMAVEHGVPRAEVESLTDESSDIWSERTRALLVAADELFSTRNLAPATFGELRRHLSQDQTVAFCMLVGHYVMAGMIINVAGVEIEGPYALA